MPRKSQPALRKALTSLVNRISSGSLTPGQELPALKRMAHEAGVSLLTMWKAAEILRKEGIISGGSGNKFRLLHIECAHLLDMIEPEPEASRAASADISFAWERVKNRIRRDVLTGVYSAAGGLPAVKELEILYKGSFRTVKRALDSLCDEGILTVGGHKYAPAIVSKENAAAKIALIGQCDNNGKLLLSSVNEEWFRIIEDVGATSRAHFVSYGYTSGLLDFSIRNSEGNPCELEDDESILGYAMIVTNNESGRDRIVRRLYHFKKPLAILDLAGGWKLPAAIHYRGIRIFAAATGLGPARKVAKYLLDLGHRRVAYVSPYHKALWSHRRLRGLEATFKNAGLPGAVFPFVFTQPRQYFKTTAGNRANVDALVAYYRTWSKGLPAEYKDVLDPIFVETISVKSMYLAELNHFLRPLFRKAGLEESITAWVCANDQVACAAQDFCRHKKIDVPGQLSIVGFDDSYEGLQRGISSYNFNLRGIMHAMIAYLLNTRAYPTIFARRPIEIEGMLVQRRTVGVTSR
ncbi:MAG: GntR family transcriptional regulator [Chitinivibrionales bacterium]|nr:GntR family transcriptional regulator [Chitinivibrionales bacterium]